MSSKRIAKELGECTTSPPAGITVALKSESDIHNWTVVLDGPANTPFADGTFGLLVSLPTTYPFKPPTVRFVTRVYHPNVTNDSLGNICLALLKPENWKPATKIAAVLEAVRQLLVEPQPDDPLETRIADEYRQDRKEFEKNARMHVSRYAQGKPDFTAAATAAAEQPAK